ncbi:MAG: hypothetical protein U0165_12305 [Polyangiaceae bacterium]
MRKSEAYENFARAHSTREQAEPYIDKAAQSKADGSGDERGWLVTQVGRETRLLAPDGTVVATLTE